MGTSPRHLPRFIPTLTEVVQSPGLAGASEQEAHDFEEISRSILQRMEPLMEHRLHEVEAMVRSAVMAHMQTLRLSLREELETAVRQALTEAASSGLDLNKLK